MPEAQTNSFEVERLCCRHEDFDLIEFHEDTFHFFLDVTVRCIEDGTFPWRPSDWNRRIDARCIDPFFSTICSHAPLKPAVTASLASTDTSFVTTVHLNGPVMAWQPVIVLIVLAVSSSTGVASLVFTGQIDVTSVRGKPMS
jgi:hypothetical protein